MYKSDIKCRLPVFEEAVQKTTAILSELAWLSTYFAHTKQPFIVGIHKWIPVWAELWCPHVGTEGWPCFVGTLHWIIAFGCSIHFSLLNALLQMANTTADLQIHVFTHRPLIGCPYLPGLKIYIELPAVKYAIQVIQSIHYCTLDSSSNVKGQQRCQALSIVCQYCVDVLKIVAVRTRTKLCALWSALFNADLHLNFLWSLIAQCTIAICQSLIDKTVCSHWHGILYSVYFYPW